MANIFMLLIVALGGTFGLVWIIHYIPNYASIFGFEFSPRLTFCKVMAPLDATLTIILTVGAWVGITSAALGINMMVYNVLTGIGISLGVLFIKKIMVPKWTKQFKQQVIDYSILKKE